MDIFHGSNQVPFLFLYPFTKTKWPTSTAWILQCDYSGALHVFADFYQRNLEHVTADNETATLHQGHVAQEWRELRSLDPGSCGLTISLWSPKSNTPGGGNMSLGQIRERI